MSFGYSDFDFMLHLFLYWGTILILDAESSGIILDLRKQCVRKQRKKKSKNLEVGFEQGMSWEVNMKRVKMKAETPKEFLTKIIYHLSSTCG